MSGLNRDLIEDLIETYQKLNTNPETATVDAGIVLENAGRATTAALRRAPSGLTQMG